VNEEAPLVPEAGAIIEISSMMLPSLSTSTIGLSALVRTTVWVCPADAVVSTVVFDFGTATLTSASSTKTVKRLLLV
jgi:hypothetical protein